MAEPTDLYVTGDSQPPSDDKQDVIRRALEMFEQLRRAPAADEALKDRVLSELGVDASGKREPAIQVQAHPTFDCLKLTARGETLMSYRDRIDAVVQSLGSQLGTPLALDADGSLSLEFSEGHDCRLAVSDAEARVSLFAPVAAVHADTRGPLFEAALRLNGDPARTGGGIVGYDPDQRELVVTTSLEGEVDIERLAGTLNDFMRAALMLRRKFNEALQTQQPDNAAGAGLAIDQAAGGAMKV